MCAHVTVLLNVRYTVSGLSMDGLLQDWRNSNALAMGVTSFLD